MHKICVLHRYYINSYLDLVAVVSLAVAKYRQNQCQWPEIKKICKKVDLISKISKLDFMQIKALLESIFVCLLIYLFPWMSYPIFQKTGLLSRKCTVYAALYLQRIAQYWDKITDLYFLEYVDYQIKEFN